MANTKNKQIMILKPLKITLFAIAICTISFTNAQEREGKKRPSPEAIFKKLDTDANGSLSFEEFIAKRKRANAKAEMLKKRFKALDADANNAISLEEYIAGRAKDPSKEEMIEKRFTKIDTDGNGSIDLEEYKAYIETSKKRRGKRKQRRHKKED